MIKLTIRCVSVYGFGRDITKVLVTGILYSFAIIIENHHNGSRSIGILIRIGIIVEFYFSFWYIFGNI